MVGKDNELEHETCLHGRTSYYHNVGSSNDRYYTRRLQKIRSPRSTLHVANRGPTTTTIATTTTPKRRGRWQHRRYSGRCIADASVSQLFVLCRPFQIDVVEVPPIPGSLLLVWLPLVVRRRRTVRSRRWRKNRSRGRCEKPGAQCSLEGLAFTGAELHRGSECCNLPLATCEGTQLQNIR